MTILVAVADSLGFRGSIMAIYLYKHKQDHFIGFLLEFKLKFLRQQFSHVVTEILVVQRQDRMIIMT